MTGSGALGIGAIFGDGTGSGLFVGATSFRRFDFDAPATTAAEDFLVGEGVGFELPVLFALLKEGDLRADFSGGFRSAEDMTDAGREVGAEGGARSEVEAGAFEPASFCTGAGLGTIPAMATAS